jgi:hypothetical protein
VNGSGRDLILGTITHLPGRTEKNHKKLSQNSRYSGRDLNPDILEYEAAGVLTTPPRCSVDIGYSA